MKGLLNPERLTLEMLHARYVGNDSSDDRLKSFADSFRKYIRENRESLFDVVLTASSAQLAVDIQARTIEPLLEKAIQDTNPNLDNNTFFSLGESEMTGVVNAAKGKYFEYLVADKLNAGEVVGPIHLVDGQHAVLADSMTQPGWDLKILDADGSVNEYLQLKATDSIGYIHSTLERYPDIEILSTSEVAEHGHLVFDSGISNAELTSSVQDAIGTSHSSLAHEFLNYFNPLLPLALMVGYEGYRLGVGKQSTDQFVLALARRTQRIAVTNFSGAAVYALGGGILALPAALAGGLMFDRYFNQLQMSAAFRGHNEKLLAMRLMQQERLLQGV